jgi:molybdopterin converting factor small subunit
MIVRLRVFGVLEHYLGGARLEVELPPGASLRDLLDLIDARWGAELPGQLWDREARRFRGPVLVMTCNADVHDYDMVLSDQQEISLLVPLAGGSDTESISS